ncbi:MAG: tetratricopeptide repeat protein [Desulfuromonadaceae bacterium]
MTQDATQKALLDKVKTYAELLERDPCSSIFIPLADIYRQLGMLDEAVAVVEKGILENPAFAEGYAAYSRIFLDRGMQDEAVGQLEKALLLDKKRITALTPLAQIRFEQGDYLSAQSLMQRAAKSRPHDSSIKQMLELIENKLVEAGAGAVSVSSDESASEVVASAGEELDEVSTYPFPGGKAPISTVTIAEIYVRQGFPEKALKVYRDLLRADPLNEYLREKLIQLKNELDEAKAPIPDTAEMTDEALSETGEIAVMSASDDEVVSASSTSVDAVADTVADSLIATFNSWLEAIRNRRGAHVC